MSNRIVIKVSVGIILNEQNEILLEQRIKNDTYSLYWGLPGGKVEKNESFPDTLKRELAEELGIRVIKYYPWINHIFYKQGVRYHISFYRIIKWDGIPYSRENQNLQWIDIKKAHTKHNLLPTILYPIYWLTIPNTYGITSINSVQNIDNFINRLKNALNKGLSLVQFREPDWPEGVSSNSLYEAMKLVLSTCREHNAKLLINSSHPKSWWSEADGVHIRSTSMTNFSNRPNIDTNSLVAISAHSSSDLEYAHYKINADFAVLGPVNKTMTHPSDQAIGWNNFRRMIKNSKIPVFSIGGQSESCRETAYKNGAHGIAGIRSFI